MLPLTCPRNRGSSKITLTTAGVLLAAVTAGGTAQRVSLPSSSESKPQPTVEERLRVAESAVLVRAPARHLMGLPILRPPTVQELAVYLGEELLEVTDVRGLEEDETWSVVIYVDAPLTDRETLASSALALAGAAEMLTAFGPVELLLATLVGEPRSWLTSTPRALESALADIALQADSGRLGGEFAALRRAQLIAQNRAKPSDAGSAESTSALVLRQVETLSRTAGDHCRSDSCLMLLVSDGFPERLETATEADGARPSSSPETSCCAHASRRLARELAGGRWVVGVVAVKRAAGEVAISLSERPPEKRQLDSAVPDRNRGGNAALSPSRYSREIPLEKLNFALRPEAAPLRRITRETGGFLAATPDGLAESLEALDRRLLVWFRHPEDPPQELAPLRVVFVPRNQDLWAPRWWRARPDDTRSERATGH